MKMPHIRSTLAAMIAVAGVVVAHASNFTVTSSTSGSSTKFIVTRDDTTAAETVNYRTVSISAYAGQHYTAKSGTLTFPAGQSAVTNTVTETTPTAAAYKFQTGTSRYYRFEITDAGGFLVTNATRTLTTGTRVTASDAFGVKNLTIQSSEYTADDRGYDSNGYKSVSSNGYFAAAAPKAYFQLVDAQLRMTLSMDAKENDDAYEYLQLLFNNTSTCDNRSGASNGDPGTPSLSSYMAGFEMDTGSKDDTYRTYTFPVTNVANNAGATNPWGYSSNGKYPLSKQKFNTTTSSRAADGRIVVPLNFTNIVLRLNASGSSGSDQWAAKSVKAHIQAVDSAAPTKLGISAAPGIHARGNEFYVSVAFSEPVTCSSATLTNTWGTLTYNSGNGSNVLTFKGTIGANASGSLNITGWSGTIKDLAGNPFVGSLSQSSLAAFTSSIAYNISCDLAGGELPDGSTPNPTSYTYDSAEITLANPVRTGYTFAGWSGTGFSGTRTTVTIPIHSHGDRAYTAHWTPIAYAISYVHATNGVDGVVNANPTSYTIEDDIVSLDNPTRTDYFFCGWYVNPDLTGSPVSYFSAADLGDRTFYAKWIVVPWNGSGTYDDPYIISTREDLDALAACVNTNSVGCRVACYRLDADIAYDPAVTNSFTPIGNYSFHFTGTFDGNGHTISGISISRPDTNYQGLFGYIREAVVKNLTLADSSIEGQSSIGGIAGYSYYSSMQNCFVIGTTLSGVDNIGTSVGRYNYGAPSGNAYRYCAAVRNGSTFTSGIGTGNNGDSSGARPCYTLAFAEGIAPVTAPQFSFPVYGTNYSYYAADQSVIVRAAAGYVIANVRVNGSDATDNGDGTFSFTMPAADATVTADLEALPAIPYIDEGGETQVCSNYTVIASAAAAVTYGESDAENWYVVTTNTTISGRLNLKGTTHLILCDGATLTVTNENGTAIDANNLTIYGQANGTGAIVANGSASGISGGQSVAINGGRVTATGDYRGIYANSVSISGGRVTANGGNYGIYANSGVTISAGNVIATGTDYGISAYGIVRLGWTNPTDSIYASSYYGSITVNGTLTDGVNIYRGSVNASDLAGKTLRPPMPAISYLDADGTERQRYAYTVLTNAAADVAYGGGFENWYAVTNDVNISGMLHFDDLPAHLILCDGATLAVTNENGTAIEAYFDLTIYGQTNGTGTVTAEGGSFGIYSGGSSSVTINGGTVTAEGGGNGIRAGSVTINGGTVTANGGEYGDGIYVGSEIILGWTNPTDSITASSYCGVVIVKNGQPLTDGSAIYKGAVDPAKIAGKTLRPHFVPYIDADGVERFCTDFTVLTNAVGNATYGTNGAENWYVVTNAVTISGQLGFRGTSHLILCDGASLAVTNANGIAIQAYDDLTIYGQTNGTGAVTATGGSYGIFGGDSVTINGGTVTATGIRANGGGVTINGGTVTANGSSGIRANGGDVTINGGTVTANGDEYGYGICAPAHNGSIILGWTNPTDSITASSYHAYYGRVSVKSDQRLTDGSAIYMDYLDPFDIAGVTLRPAYSISLPEGVVASGVVRQDGTTAYARPGDTVTLSAAPGVSIRDVTVNGDALEPVDGIYSFAASAASITVAAAVGIPYIDADGVERLCADFTVLTNAEGYVEYGGGSGWYVATNAVTISGQLFFGDTSAHLILCDGATLVVTNANGSAIQAGDLTIYGQTNGTGTVTAKGARGVSAGGSVTINGGTVTATGGTGIYVNRGDVTINGGTVTANATGFDGKGINSSGDVTINGGTVTANGDYGISGDSVTINGGNVTATGGGYGIFGGDVTINGGTVTATGRPGIIALTSNITLGWTNPTDSIYARSYATGANRRVRVKSGQRLTDGTTIYKDTDDLAPSAIAGVTLRPPMPAISYLDEGGAERQRYLYTVLTNATGDVEYGTNGAENWYVVTNAVTISGRLYFGDYAAHLILCDGATLAVTNADGRAIQASNLTIYGQTNGSGAVTATGTNGGGISAGGSVTINGGTVTVNGTNGYGISAGGSVTINGGTVTAESGPGGGGCGIYANNGSIILGWTNPTDSITASSYRGAVNVKDGQRLTDGTTIYMNYLGPFDIAGVTLRPYIDTPTYPAYLGLPADPDDDTDEDFDIRANYDAWALRYGYDALGANETAYLLDVAPWAVTNGVAPLKVAEMGVTNILVGEAGDFGWVAQRMGYTGGTLPIWRLVLASDVAPLKEGFYDALTVCNGYLVLRIGTDLSVPKSEWLETGWFARVEDGRAELFCPEFFLEKYRERVARETGKPCPGLFLSVSLSPRQSSSTAFSEILQEELGDYLP